MRHYRAFILAVTALFASGCTSGVVTKHFRVIADPPDSEIRIVSGTDRKELRYHSPAIVAAEVPKDPALAAKSVLEVRRDSYMPKTLPLTDIRDGAVVTVKLEKILREAVRYRLSYRLVGPVVSPELHYHDKYVEISFEISEKSLQLRLKNLTPHSAKILWERAEYADIHSRRHRIMHSGIRFQDRNNPVPDQTVPSHGEARVGVIPVRNVYLTSPGNAYDVHPLFPLENDAAAGLKGKIVSLFLPLEIDRQIIPYQFKIEITDAVRERRGQ